MRRARRPKPCKLVGEFGVVVAGLLQANWSPQQISALLPGLFPDREDWRVSHETIYQSLFVQTRGELRREPDGPPADPTDDEAGPRHGPPGQARRDHPDQRPSG